MTTPIKGSRCGCCKLVHVSFGRDGFCAVCSYHQSREAEQTLKRHVEHEEMLRERLGKSTAWAEQAQVDVAEFKQKMHWSYRSRDNVIKVLSQINDMHSLHIDGTCKCKTKNCKIANLLSDNSIQHLIRKADEFEDQQREKERQWQDMMRRDPYELDELIDGSGALRVGSSEADPDVGTAG